MKDRLSGLSVEELEAKLNKSRRRRELEAQRKERKLVRAISTLGISAEIRSSDLGTDQAAYETRIQEEGLPQEEGESNKDFLERAARICRSNELSSQEVAERYLSREKRGIAGSEMKEQAARLAVHIASVYRSSVEPD